MDEGNVKPEGWQYFPLEMRRNAIVQVMDRIFTRYGDNLSDSQMLYMQSSFNDCGRRDFDPAFSFARAAELRSRHQECAHSITPFVLRRELEILRTMPVVTC